jgi:hypothetical protein
MVEYDATGTNALRVFNPNIAINPHALRIDRYGNIWATDAYWNVLWKLNPKGEVLMTLGKRGESGAWNDAPGTGCSISRWISRSTRTTTSTSSRDMAEHRRPRTARSARPIHMPRGRIVTPSPRTHLSCRVRIRGS